MDMRFLSVVTVGLLATVLVADASAMYQPGPGRWMQRDPIGYASRDMNLYGYVGSNAIRSVDPRGLTKCDNVCADAKREGLDQGAVGGVICCLGQAFSCVWWENQSPMPDVFGGENEKAIEIMKKCVRAHEDDHHGDIECPSGGCPVLTRPPFKDGKDRKAEECHAFDVEAQCLLDSYDECNGDPECETQITIKHLAVKEKGCGQ